MPGVTCQKTVQVSKAASVKSRRKRDGGEKTILDIVRHNTPVMIRDLDKSLFSIRQQYTPTGEPEPFLGITSFSAVSYFRDHMGTVDSIRIEDSFLLAG